MNQGRLSFQIWFCPVDELLCVRVVASTHVRLDAQKRVPPPKKATGVVALTVQMTIAQRFNAGHAMRTNRVPLWDERSNRWSLRIERALSSLMGLLLLVVETQR
jgi:hypothetical protein